MYRLKDECLFQKDYRIEEDERIFDYVRSPESEDIDPEDAIAVISIQGTPYELNLPAAIILDELIRNAEMKEIIEKIAALFEIDKVTAKAAIDDCVDELMDLNAIEKN